jgi:hypothetical protein
LRLILYLERSGAVAALFESGIIAKAYLHSSKCLSNTILMPISFSGSCTLMIRTWKKSLRLFSCPGKPFKQGISRGFEAEGCDLGSARETQRFVLREFRSGSLVTYIERGKAHPGYRTALEWLKQ